MKADLDRRRLLRAGVGMAFGLPFLPAGAAQQRVTLRLTDVPLEEALRQLFAPAGREFRLEPALRATVTVSLVDVPFEVALRALLRAARGAGTLSYRLEAGVYRITGQPAEMRPDPLALARTAADDLIRHFWVADAAGGHILDTVHGRRMLRSPEDRGNLWERAGLVLLLDNLHQVTNEADYRRRIATDWAYVQRRFRAAELETCGQGTPSPGSEQAGWNALLLLTVHRATGDAEALARARGLFRRAYDRWSDGLLGGGLRHSDDQAHRSLHQSLLALAGVRMYRLTGDRRLREAAVGVYEWVEQRLLRPDGLYWRVFDMNGPQRSADPAREGASDTSLAGNTAMGVLHALLHRATGQEIYRDQALRTAEAFRIRATDGRGVFLNDQDAPVSGLLMGDWAREVLTLPGIRADDRALVRQTALAIARRARTPQGLFAPSWNGSTPDRNPWPALGISADQLTTSASAAGILAAAAQLKANGI